jgi:hypothetical protein
MEFSLSLAGQVRCQRQAGSNRQALFGLICQHATKMGGKQRRKSYDNEHKRTEVAILKNIRLKKPRKALALINRTKDKLKDKGEHQPEEPEQKICSCAKPPEPRNGSSGNNNNTKRQQQPAQGKDWKQPKLRCQESLEECAIDGRTNQQQQLQSQCLRYYHTGHNGKAVLMSNACHF